VGVCDGVEKEYEVKKLVLVVWSVIVFVYVLVIVAVLICVEWIGKMFRMMMG
jgi:hypothetical protein